MIRTYNCHFYYFVSLTTASPEKKEQRKQSGQNGYEYAKYKWGSYIKHNKENNIKFI